MAEKEMKLSLEQRNSFALFADEEGEDTPSFLERMVAKAEHNAPAEAKRKEEKERQWEQPAAAEAATCQTQLRHNIEMLKAKTLVLPDHVLKQQIVFEKGQSNRVCYGSGAGAISVSANQQIKGLKEKEEKETKHTKNNKEEEVSKVCENNEEKEISDVCEWTRVTKRKKGWMNSDGLNRYKKEKQEEDDGLGETMKTEESMMQKDLETEAVDKELETVLEKQESNNAPANRKLKKKKKRSIKKDRQLKVQADDEAAGAGAPGNTKKKKVVMWVVGMVMVAVGFSVHFVEKGML